MVEPSWIGRRISVRRATHRHADGTLATADHVGDLVGLDASTAVLDTRYGLVEVPVAHVVAGRLAPPSTADELALEAVAAQGMRAADTEALGGWLLRADHGFLRRVNSVLPLRQLGRPLDDALATAHEWYAERGLPLIIACPTEARRLLDNDLDVRGWQPVVEAHVMTARLDVLPLNEPDPRVTLTGAPDDGWLGLYRGGEDVSAAARAMLTRHDHVVFAEVVDGGQTLAIGRGVVDDGWLGVAAVEVASKARRRGLATAVMRALLRWGLAAGASHCYLQVETDNAAAIIMYERLGFTVHHDYRYRVEPPEGFVPARPW